MHINVMKCKKCGMVQLERCKYNAEEYYTAGMLKSAYFAVVDGTLDMNCILKLAYGKIKEEWIYEKNNIYI